MSPSLPPRRGGSGRIFGGNVRDFSGTAFLWSLPFLVALFPIVLLSVYSYRIAADSVQNLVQSTNLSAVSNLSQQMNADMLQIFNVTSAFSSLPGTVDAVRNLDDKAMRTRLKPLVLSSPAVNRAFVTTTGGIIWSDYPPAVDAVGRNLSPSPWFQDVLHEERAVISTAYLRSEEPPAIITAIASPVFFEEKMVGILVLEYNLSSLSEQLQNIHLAQSGYLYVLDGLGTLVAHPEEDRSNLLYGGYRKVPSVRAALEGDMRTTEYEDPLVGKKMLATFLPVSVGGQMWVIVANQPVAEAYAPLQSVKVRIALAGGFLTFLTFAMIVSLARTRARNERLNRELKKLASIVEHSNDAIVGLTLEGTVLTWNAAATRLLGYASEEMLGKPFLSASADQKLTVRDLLARVGRGDAVEHVESVWTTKGGTALPVSLTISPVRDGSGGIVGGSVIAQNIAERRRIEAMKDNFIAFVSHQLKAPVAAIRWHVELLLEEAKKEHYSEYVLSLLKEIYDVNAQDHALIADLLNVSRINRGVIQMNVESVSLQEIVEMAVQNYKQPAQEKGLQLVVEMEKEPLLVAADKEKMAEAVSNSISNAIKHTKEGSITLRTATKDHFALVHVTDTGEGMGEDILQKLFTKDQLLGSNTDAEASAGLGLFIAKHFMTLQGGDITVLSQVGAGTTFTYWIPLAK